MSAPTKRLPFQIRWQKALMKSALDSTAKLVGCAIVVHADRYGREAHPSKETLMQLCSLSERTVDEAVNRLEDAGWIGVERSYGRVANRYVCHLNPAPDAPVQRARVRVPNPAPADPVLHEGEKGSNPAPNVGPTPRPGTPEVNPEDKIKSKTVGRKRTHARRPHLGDEDFPAWLAGALCPAEQPFVSYPDCGSYFPAALITVEEAEQAFAAHELDRWHRELEARL